MRLALALAVALATALGAVPVASANGCGVPFSNTTYLVSTESHLRTLATCDTTWNVDLQNDITLSSTPFTPIPNFRGTFDGNGNTISGLTVSGGSGNDQGLMKILNGGTVRDLTLANPTVSGASNVGAVVGQMIQGTMTGVTATSATITATTSFAGGIVGKVEIASGRTGVITNVRSSGTITSATLAGGIAGTLRLLDGTLTVSDAISSAAIAGGYGSGGIAGGAEAPCDEVSTCSLLIQRAAAHGAISGVTQYGGGLVGVATISCGGSMCSGGAISLVISDSYATGTVAGTQIGGLIGGAMSSVYGDTVIVRRTYAAGAVSGTLTGALVSYQSAATSAASFWNPTDSAVSTSALGTQSTDAAMRTSTPYVNGLWAIVAGWEPPNPPSKIWGQCSTVRGGLPFLLVEYATDPCVASVPSAPTALTATPGDGRATIAFTAGPSDAPITNYEVQLDGGAWQPLSPAATTSPIVVTGLTNGTTYAVALRAVSSVGAGGASTPVTVTPQAATPASETTRNDTGGAPDTTPPAPTPTIRTAGTPTATPTSLTLTVATTGPGRLTLIGTRPASRARANRATACRATVRATRSGTYRITCVMNRAARSALRAGPLTIRWRLAFAPQGGGTPVVRAGTRTFKRLPAQTTPSVVTG